MKALTSKNYEQLPEIKKRKEEEMKKNELKKRQERVKMLDQVNILPLGSSVTLIIETKKQLE